MFGKVIRYFRESWEELKKVVWPSRRETVRNTLIVIGISLGVAIFLGALDFVLSIGLKEILPQ